MKIILVALSVLFMCVTIPLGFMFEAFFIGFNHGRGRQEELGDYCKSELAKMKKP